MGHVFLVSSAALPAAWCIRRCLGAPQVATGLLIALAGELLMRASQLPEGTAWLDLTLFG